MTMSHRDLCYNEVCYKGTALESIKSFQGTKTDLPNFGVGQMFLELLNLRQSLKIKKK